MNNKYFVFGCMVILASCVFACDNGTTSSQGTSPGTSPGTSKFSSAMWGEWYGIQAGVGSGGGTAPWYITSTNVYATFPGSAIRSDHTGHVELSTSGGYGLIAEVKLSGASAAGLWRLYPLRTANARFSGSIANVTSPGQSINRVLGGIGGIEVVIENLNDAAQKETTSTNTNGDFTAGGTIPGDPYGVTVDGKTVEVNPNADGDDIGTITIADGLNFKTSVEPSSGIMLANGTSYSCKIKIENVGSATASACNYLITGEDGESYSGVVGSVAPGKTKEITISAKCGTISVEKRFKKYTVVITDTINNRTWNDSVSLLFYKDTMSLTIMSDFLSESPNYGMHVLVRGIIVSPERKSYPFQTFGSMSNIVKTINVPRLKGNYLIAIVYASQETIYGMDMSIFSTHLNESAFQSQIQNFTDTGNYEPNDTEGTAKTINGPIISYFHDGDIDHYLVRVD
jgi:hypothetical protein